MAKHAKRVAPPSGAPPQAPPAPAQPKSALIVEDSVDFSNLLKFIVEDEGLVGIQFPLTDQDIVAWVKERRPSVVLMDLALRRKGGMEYIAELKADPDTAEVPIIIISGRDLSQREVMELQARGIRYLRKGRVEVEEIKKEIRAAAGVGAPGPEKAK